MNFYLDLDKPYYFSFEVGLHQVKNNKWFELYYDISCFRLSVLKINFVISFPEN